MTGKMLIDLYYAMARVGLVKSKRDFSRRYLGRGLTYFRDFEQRNRLSSRVPSRSVDTLQKRLKALLPLLPHAIASEVGHIIAQIERGCRIADQLGYGRAGR